MIYVGAWIVVGRFGYLSATLRHSLHAIAYHSLLRLLPPKESLYWWLSKWTLISGFERAGVREIVPGKEPRSANCPKRKPSVRTALPPDRVVAPAKLSGVA